MISSSAGLSGKRIFTFLGGRKRRSLTKTTGIWKLQTHIGESLFDNPDIRLSGTRELEMFPQAH